MTTERFIRLPPGAAGGPRLCGRRDVNPVLGANAAMNVKLFASQLAARFGPPDDVSDAEYSYSIEDRETGFMFEARSANSGPCYAGVPSEAMVDFEHDDYRIRPEVLQILVDFEHWLTQPGTAQPGGAQP
jgi:hypothetical protein